MVSANQTLEGCQVLRQRLLVLVVEVSCLQTSWREKSPHPTINMASHSVCAAMIRPVLGVDSIAADAVQRDAHRDDEITVRAATSGFDLPLSTAQVVKALNRWSRRRWEN
jgi:hypothetical protein